MNVYANLIFCVIAFHCIHNTAAQDIKKEDIIGQWEITDVKFSDYHSLSSELKKITLGGVLKFGTQGAINFDNQQSSDEGYSLFHLDEYSRWHLSFENQTIGFYDSAEYDIGDFEFSNHSKLMISRICDDQIVFNMEISENVRINLFARRLH